jgi:hypothetical protein
MSMISEVSHRKSFGARFDASVMQSPLFDDCGATHLPLNEMGLSADLCPKRIPEGRAKEGVV